MSRSEQLLIDEGYASLRSGDSSTARRLFESASVNAERGATLEGLARAGYLDHDYLPAIQLWGSAYEAYRRERDGVGAIRVARTLAYMYLSIVGDRAVMQGWFARAVSLLAEEGPCPETGWVSLNKGMFESDQVVKQQHYRDALAHARESGDSSLEFATLAYLGASLVHDDRVDEGMMLLDEALAAVAGRDVDDFTVVEEIFCQLFAACEYAHDVDRADQWIRIGEDIAARRKLPAVAAFCRTHYGGLLTAAGRWGEADVALSDAVRIWGLGHSWLRPGALVRLADLRVRQGRFEEAEQLLSGLDSDVEAALPLAATHLQRGETDLAVGVLTRALGEIDPTSVAAVPLWATLVDAHIAAGDHRGAESFPRSADGLRHKKLRVLRAGDCGDGSRTTLSGRDDRGSVWLPTRGAVGICEGKRRRWSLHRRISNWRGRWQRSNPRGRSSRRAPRSRASSVFLRGVRQTPSAR